MKLDTAHIWTIWIGFFALLAAPVWPQPLGLTFMALAFFGVIHQSVLIWEQIERERIDQLSPYQYERFCAGILTKKKWRTELTQASHDQGADIIATKNGIRIVIQCKKYTKPVGNHAVQQVVAAVAHQQAQRGVVVATSPFTQPAKSLAISNNILLLHHEELPDIDRLLNRST